MRGSLQSYMLVAVAVIVILLLANTWRLSGKVEDRDRTIAALTADLATTVAANESAADALKLCRQTNTGIIDGLRADLDAAKQAAERTAAEADRLRAMVDAARRRRSQIYDLDPSAAEWARTRVPDAIADSLRN